jgi:hypothetical protein
MYRLWITEVNEDNHVINWYGGTLAIESDPYLYYFEVEEEVFKNAQQYKVVNGELVLK